MPTVLADDLLVLRGGVAILEGASVRLEAGLYALTGDNGAGKSTLLRALAGVQPISRGRIEIDGHDLWRRPVEARRRLGYLPESPELFPYLTARELLRTANAVRGVAPTAGEERFGRWVRPAALDLRIGTLSAGQRRKLGLVAATCHEPPVLLLDEPDNTLDAAAVADLCELLQAWRDEGRTVVVATHRASALAVSFDGRLHVRGRKVELASES
ncbi:ATP-binding cassette domain-containing protein [Paraliomyxa miuraensis]|uniref:ATP-binding cassette domain-containing protein n=1 Tax=Paraliomyxa miuraensis TaxID=376150 RepID=UPI0022586C2A|nr:ABC transporter ATP-binding protein [Paraliomyxa miuraensis]MCX4247710.1 ABC transporter ATP-binding protein [Paraliomyxa miuraensis]